MISPATIVARLACLLLLTLPALADTLKGRVVAVSDGDTITLLDANRRQHRVRLLGIDAPERDQPFGAVSRQHLADLVFGKQVTVTFFKRDPYGRILGKVTVGDRDINREQLKAGLAWFYKYYEKDLLEGDRATYEGTEREVREARLGLWKDRGPTPPWDYRRRRRVDPPSEQLETPVTTNAALILGNKASRVYHRPDCPDYGKVSPGNQVFFQTRDEAERAGYRMARNCP